MCVALYDCSAVLARSMATKSTHFWRLSAQAIEVNTHVLATLYKALHDHSVFLEGTLLKPNMVLPGKDCPTTYTPLKRGEATITTFVRTIPAAVPSVHFLSGGQTPTEASVNLDAINKAKKAHGRCPWNLTFSFSRAIQDPVQRIWGGKKENTAAAQAELLRQVQNHSKASLGQYSCDAADGEPAAKRAKK